MSGQMVTAGHLGGYIDGGDAATYYPDLWDWLVDELKVCTVVDVGCGDGVAVRHFEQRGCLVVGVDGMPQVHPKIVRHDFTTGPYVPPGADYDLAWSCEFVEHVEEQFVENFLATFRACRIVLMTHADPGQPGWHHVNCRDDAYWKHLLTVNGFVFDEALTGKTRELAAKNEDPWNHYRRSGLAFVRRDT